jgi:hypothetical protein
MRRAALWVTGNRSEVSKNRVSRVTYTQLRSLRSWTLKRCPVLWARSSPGLYIPLNEQVLLLLYATLGLP